MTTKIKSGVIADNAIVSAHISSGAISSGHLSSIDTDAVSEGSSNLYFTTTRARTSLSVTDSGGDGSLAYDNSTGAITYTGPSASEVRAHISVTDSGGDGSLAYSNGVITYVGPSASEVRAHLSAGTGVTYSSGEFSIGQSVATTASPTFADINVTGNINVTGDLNTVSVTDLDVTDKTITLGAGQNEAASGGSGIVVDGSNASILWDETNDEWDFNKVLKLTTPSTTTASITAEETSGATIRMGAGGSSGFIGTMSNHYLRFFVNSQEKASLTANGDFTVTNDIKVTTTNPRIDYDGGNSGALRFFSTSAAQERMRITSGGNVGIGTTNPQDRLHVTLDSATTNAEVEVMRVEATSSGTPVDGFGPFIDFRGDRQAGNPDSYGRIGFESDGMTPTTVDGAFIIQPAEDGVYTERMRVSSGGNVGIGVTPSSWSSSVYKGLQIGTGIGVGGIIGRVDGTNSINLGLNWYYSGGATNTYIDSAAATNYSQEAGTHRWYHAASGTAGGALTFSESMRIDSSGKVGIGTGSTANTYKFTVNSGTDNVVADFVSTDATAAIRLKDSGGNVELSTTSGDFRVQPSGGSYAFRVETNGNGTFTGNTSGTSFYGTTYIQGGTGIVKDNSTYGAIFGSNSASRGIMIARDASASYPDIYIKGSNGYIGFDQNSPQYPMHYGESTIIPNGRNLNWDNGEIYPAHQYLAVSQTSNAGTTRPTAIGLQLYNESSTVNTFAPAISWSHQSTSTNFSQSSAAIAGRRTDAVSGDTNWHGGELHLYTAKPSSQGLRDTASLIINTYAQAHLGAGDSDTRLYIGSQGGEFGGNSSNWIRGSTSNLMYNAGGGAHIWEVGGAQRLSLGSTGVITQQTAGTSDSYDMILRSTDSGDPGLSITRDNAVGFGIAVRAAATDYADFQVNASGSPSYGETGKLRMYSNGGISIPGTALWATAVGNTFGTTGNHYMIRSANSTGNETIIVNNTTSGGSIGILQYRINAGVQGQYLIGTSGSGITFTGSSDYRLKENISTITESSLDKINQLRLVSYNWNDLSDMPTDTTEIGVIAHEIEEVFPEFVDGEKDAVYTQEEIDARGDPETTNEEVGDIKAQTVSLVNKDMIIHILHAIKELKAENDALRARIETLEG